MLDASVAEYTKFHGGVPASAIVKLAGSPSHTVVVPVADPLVDNTPVIEGETSTDAVRELLVAVTKLEVVLVLVKL